MSEALVSILLALADDELITGHRHSEWTGFAPHMEEDVAFSSIAQDEIGHAAAYYTLASHACGHDPDRLALGREPEHYRNAVLCERPNGDWAYTLARHWLYDNADQLRLEGLQASTHEPLAQLAGKMRREERWHILHADAWIRRVAHGPIEGRAKLLSALSESFAEAGGLFEPFDDEDEGMAEGWLGRPSSELRDRFVEQMGTALDQLDLPVEPHVAGTELIASSSGDLIARGEAPGVDSSAGGGLGGRRGHHSDDFKSLWAEMTRTYRAEPGATW